MEAIKWKKISLILLDHFLRFWFCNLLTYYLTRFQGELSCRCWAQIDLPQWILWRKNYITLLYNYIQFCLKVFFVTSEGSIFTERASVGLKKLWSNHYSSQTGNQTPKIGLLPSLASSLLPKGPPSNMAAKLKENKR